MTYVKLSVLFSRADAVSINGWDVQNWHTDWDPDRIIIDTCSDSSMELIEFEDVEVEFDQGSAQAQDTEGNEYDLGFWVLSPHDGMKIRLFDLLSSVDAVYIGGDFRVTKFHFCSDPAQVTITGCENSRIEGMIFPDQDVMFTSHGIQLTNTQGGLLGIYFKSLKPTHEEDLW